jgi:8-oxo-dGTP diphosphatase
LLPQAAWWQLTTSDAFKFLLANYNRFYMSKQPIGCVILVIKENKVLLGKRINAFGAGQYGLPGGRVEVGERLVIAANRELAEETGLVPSDLEYIGVVKEHQGDKDFVHFVFKCEQFTGEPVCKEPDKCEEWEWLSLDNLPQAVLAGHLSAIDIYTNPSISFRDR